MHCLPVTRVSLQDVHSETAAEGTSDTAARHQTAQTDGTVTAEADVPVKTSLLAATAAARKGAPKETEDQKRLKEEQEMLHNITNRTALKTFAELAKVVLVAGCNKLFRRNW